MKKILFVLAGFIIVFGSIFVLFGLNQKNFFRNNDGIKNSSKAFDLKRESKNQTISSKPFESQHGDVISEKQTSEKLLNTLKDKTATTEARIKAANSLVEIQTPEAFEPMDEILKNDHEEIVLRYKIARGFGSIDDERAVSTLSELLEDSEQDQHLRIISALSLGNIGGEIATQTLLDSLYDSDEAIRFKVLQALENTNNPDVAEDLIEHLEDPDKYVKANALYALGKLGNSSHTPIIKDVLESTTDDFIKIGCIDALGNIGGEEALAILNDYKNHPNQILRANAERALQTHK